ncbi:MAG: hypothetical protein KHX56_05465 [Clostridiales bacterium]|nr:hypothetical protein [Clostridiales bacterium]
MRENVKKLYEKIREKSSVSMETYRIIQETYRNMIGQPLVKCRAQAFYNIMERIPVYIEKGDLLAGNGAACVNGLEIDYANGIWNQYEIDALKKDGYTFAGDEELLYQLNESTPPYGFSDGIAEALSQDSFLMPFLRSGMALVKWDCLEQGRQTLQCSAQGGLNLTPAQALVCLDYETALKKGLRAMIHECEEQLRQITFTTTRDYDRYVYIKCMKKSLEGICLYAKRMADLAGEQAVKEKDLKWREQLLQMEKICRRVPEFPAQNFREAIQMYWFIFLTVACPNAALGMGRLDQLFYPYYVRDIEAGRITDEDVLELFELLRIKDYHLGTVQSKDNRDQTNGEAKWHNIVIGGVKRDGSDAANPLSYLILKALQECPSAHPTVTLRVAQSTPDALLKMGLECVRMGLSMPAFVGDKSYLAYLEMNGVEKEDARDYVLTGCIDVNLPGKSRTMSACMFITPMCLEVFLNHGMKDGEMLGHDLGDLDQWADFDEFMAAFKQEFKYFIYLMSQYSNLMIVSMQQNFPEPVKTAFMYRGIEDGVDYQVKEMPFENAGVICPVGLVNLGNALYAIKKLVYEERSLSLNELKAALDADWKGYEELLDKCLNLPKYGNDNEAVDAMVAEMYACFDQYCHEMPCVTGTVYRGSAVSIFGHAPGGAMTKATPDGRFNGETLADAGASPMRGQDVNGPLAVIKSAIKIPQDSYQAVLFNMKFQPGAVSSEADLYKLGAMIRTYFDHGGKHIQFNIVDEKVLQDARIHPKDHRDLMVRVAGYSAYYVELTARLQDEILARTKNTSVK